MLHIPGARPQVFLREIKTAAPAFPNAPAWHSTQTWEEQFYDSLDVADELSVHVNTRWEGSLERVQQAAELVRSLGLAIPIMAKGYHATDNEIDQAIERGADKVLVCLGVGGREELPREDLLTVCRFEVATIDALRTLPDDAEAVWNSRDLETGLDKTETFDQARAAYTGRLCQASNIRTVADVHPEADMVLVGRHASEFSGEVRQKGYVLR